MKEEIILEKKQGKALLIILILAVIGSVLAAGWLFMKKRRVRD
jgi:hypothetical protein